MQSLGRLTPFEFRLESENLCDPDLPEDISDCVQGPLRTTGAELPSFSSKVPTCRAVSSEKRGHDLLPLMARCLKVKSGTKDFYVPPGNQSPAVVRLSAASADGLGFRRAFMRR